MMYLARTLNVHPTLHSLRSEMGGKPQGTPCSIMVQGNIGIHLELRLTFGLCNLLPGVEALEQLPFLAWATIEFLGTSEYPMIGH